MSFEESYSKRLGLMTVLGGYIKAVKDDQGLEKAVEYAKTSAHIDCDVMMKDFIASDSILAPLEARDRLRRGNPGSGIDSEVELVSNEVIASTGKCVYYDGWSTAGLKPDEIEELCRSRFEVYGERVWRAQNPNIEVELRQFKDNPEGLCLEVLKFKE